MNTYTLDAKLFVTLTVKATSQDHAEAILRETMDGAEANFGAWPDGSPVLGTVGYDNDGGADLIEINGEAV